MISEILRLRAAGLSVFPVHPKSKRPVLPWVRFQKQIVGLAEAKTWRRYSGIAIAAGKVSGGRPDALLVCIDIDVKHDENKTIHQEYFDAIRLAGFETALKKVVIQQTPTGGYHVLFRCGIEIRNLKLARSRTSPEAIIETRGEGGYFLCAPSHGYKVIHGDLANIPFFDDRTTEVFIESAKYMDDSPPPPPMPKPKPRLPRKQGDKLSPFQDFNERGSVEEIMECAKSGGWKYGFQKGSVFHLTRPGKNRGTSAVLFANKRTFYVFTTSTDLENAKGYSPSSVMAYVKHEGDLTGAARELKEMGYGQ